MTSFIHATVSRLSLGVGGLSPLPADCDDSEGMTTELWTEDQTNGLRQGMGQAMVVWV